LPLLFGTSCKKDCNPTPYYPLDQDFLSYFAFPVGSWWVYEEVNSGERDSTFIFYSNNRKDDEFLGRNDGCNIVYEYEVLKLHEVIRKDTLNGIASLLTSSNGNEVWYYFYKQNGSLSFFAFPDNRDTLDEDAAYIQARHDSIAIAGHFYKEVIVVRHPPYEVQGSHPRITYYSKNIGVVRRDFTDGTQWELVKYHINQ